jgi:hypothetical protein
MYFSLSLEGYWRALACALWLLLLPSLLPFPFWLSVVWARCGGALAGIWSRARFRASFAWLVAGSWLCPPVGGLGNGPAKQADDWFGCLCLTTGKLCIRRMQRDAKRPVVNRHPKDAVASEGCSQNPARVLEKFLESGVTFVQRLPICLRLLVSVRLSGQVGV